MKYKVLSLSKVFLPLRYHKGCFLCVSIAISDYKHKQAEITPIKEAKEEKLEKD